ncbi:hypothetical protein ACIA58_36635 [Kribbella sp. NPDC051586]|uniref:hypothetical protein n=1 Tax=Kribbella sp. NPDC051586 TaxID=3364118 RepID=UPI00379E55D9
MNRRQLAKTVLFTYDLLRAANLIEPDSDAEGRPLNPDEWLDWYRTMFVPANEAWHKAMEELERSTGDDFPGLHPDKFRPYCNQILNETASRS